MGTQHLPFYGQKIFVCAICSFKSLLWILIFFDFKNRTNPHTPFCFWIVFPFCNFSWKKPPRASLLKKIAAPGLRLFFIFHWEFFVLWSQWHGHRPRVIRCSKPSHSFSCFFFFSCFHWSLFFFYDSVFLAFFLMRSLFLLCNFCFFLPLFCFICLFFPTVFFSPFSKLFLFQLFFSWSPLAFPFFSEPFLCSTSSSSIYFWIPL